MLNAYRTLIQSFKNNFKSNFIVIKNFFIYSIGASLTKFITAFINLMIINIISPEEYGYLSLINSFIAICPIFLNLGLRQAFGVDFFHRSIEMRKKMLQDIISIYLLISVPIILFAIIFYKKINCFFHIKENEFFTIIAILICFIHFFSELFLQTLRYQLKALKLTIIQITSGLISIISALIFIYMLELKISGFLLSNLISMFFISSIGFIFYYRKIKTLSLPICSIKDINYYFKLGAPFIPGIIFSWFLSFGDRWVLAKYSTLYYVGIYSLADSFGQLFQMIVLYPLSGSYIPSILNEFSSNKGKIISIENRNIKFMWLSMFLMLIIIGIGYALSRSLFYKIIPLKYHESIPYILLILIGQIIFMGSYFATCYLLFLKRTYILAGLNISTSVLNIILNLLLVPKFSIIGCIVATIISYSIYLIGILYVTKIIKKNHNLEITNLFRLRTKVETF